MKHKIMVSDQCYREIREKLLAVGDGHLLQDNTIYREINMGRMIIRNAQVFTGVDIDGNKIEYRWGQ